MLVVLSRKGEVTSGGQCTGAAWPSSARVVRCLVKSSNERNPCELLPADNAGDSVQTAQINWEEGGDDVRSVWPLRLGLHTYYNAQHNENRDRKVEEICKTGPSSDWRLQLASMKLESLVIAGQQHSGESVPGLVHTARHTTKASNTRSRWPNRKEGAVEGGVRDWGEVVTR